MEGNPKKRPQIWRSSIFGPMIFTKDNWVLASRVAEKTHEVRDLKDSVFAIAKKRTPPPWKLTNIFWKKNWWLVQMIHVLFKRVLLFWGQKIRHFRCKVTLYFKPPGPQCCLRSHGWIVIGSRVFVVWNLLQSQPSPRSRHYSDFQKKTPQPAKPPPPKRKNRWWFQTFFIFTPIWKISNLTHIFQMGWFNHQPEKIETFRVLGRSGY